MRQDMLSPSRTGTPASCPFKQQPIIVTDSSRRVINTQPFGEKNRRAAHAGGTELVPIW